MKAAQETASMNSRGHNRSAAQDPAHVRPLNHDEAARMARTELDRALTLLDSLSPEEWSRPTACTRWDVRQMVAHMAGSAASLVSGAEFRRQGSRRARKPYLDAGFSRLDAMNQIQVDDRSARSPAELLADLRELGPRALERRRRLPAVLRAVRLPVGAAYPLGSVWVSIGYMSDTILLRDAWMHRLDISRATGREMVLTPEHDGRFTALLMREVAELLARQIPGLSLRYELTGTAGGAWQIGSLDAVRGAAVRLDALDFHLLASGRLSPADAPERAAIEGSMETARRALELTSAPY